MINPAAAPIIIISTAHDESLDIDEKQKKSADLKLRRVLSASEWQDLLKDMRNNSDIRILNENI